MMDSWFEKIEDLKKKTQEGNARTRDFYALLKKMRGRPEVRRKFAKSLGDINRRLFFAAHRVIPFSVGVALELFVLFVAVSLGVFSITASNRHLVSIALVAAQILTVISLHPLAHIVFGRIMGIRFLGFYFNGPLKIEPGVKMDYETFLLRSRAVRSLFFFLGVVGTIVGAFFWLFIGLYYPYPVLVKWILSLFAVLLLLSEFFPLFFIWSGRPRLFGFSWYRGDLVKMIREWKTP